MPSIDEIIDKHTYTFSVTECVVQDVDKLRASIEAALSAARAEERDAAKDCRACANSTHRHGAACRSTAKCIDGDQHKPTQPVRLWEK